ncbi:MAG: glycosyltransferase [Planctomycetes bacterium]|nr:glycosyltransferase [Planctomycetota bacterium]
MTAEFKLQSIITRLNIGGPSRILRVLHEGLPRFGFQVRLACGQVADGEEEATTTAAFVTDRLPELGRRPAPRSDFRSLKTLEALLRRERPDIVHTHLAKAGLLGRLAAGRAGVPVTVHSFHGHTFDGYWSRSRSALLVRVERYLARRTTALVTHSEGQASELGRYLGRSAAGKISVIPPPIDLLPGAPTEDLRSSLDIGNQFVIAFVARLAPVKDPESFLRIVKRLVERIPRGVVAIVAGGGTVAMEQRLHDLVDELGLRTQVRWLGFRPDPSAVYQAADAVVMTSRNEGTPLVVLEAAAFEVPLVAYRVGGIADLASEGISVRLVARGDEEGMANALVDLAGTRSVDLDRHLAARSEQVRPEHATELVVRRTAELYRRLAVSRAGRR